MRVPWTVLVLPAILAACGYVDDYEERVYDFDPVYCYRTIGGVECFETPHHRDERRMVNYYGPHPSRFDRPEPPEPADLQAPPSVNFWVKDPEPVPRAAPVGYRKGSLPWLEQPTPAPDPDG